MGDSGRIARCSHAPTDILVVGAGPAGLSAAVAAAGAGTGRRVAIVDDNPYPGGQIWRSDGTAPRGRARALLEAARRLGVEILPDTRVVARVGPGRLAAEAAGAPFELRHETLVLATGSRELFLPFPGWTLPGVAGAGGLQALVKGGLPIAGKRVVVAGSGPLLLAVAAYLRKRGARIELVAEQAPFASIAAFGAGLLASPAKAVQAVILRARLAGVRWRTGCWPVEALGDGRLDRVRLRTDRGRDLEVACDHLACGFGLLPQTELARLLGCETSEAGVRVDERQRTTAPGVLAAGEATGIGGADLAIVEGTIAGLEAAGTMGRGATLFRRRERWRAFSRRLDRAFAPRADLRGLPRDDTILCRCEDVTFGEARRHRSAREAKLQTRCGMGPCQGRVCGAAGRFLLGWGPDSVRPPALPASIAVLAAAGRTDDTTTTTETCR